MSPLTQTGSSTPPTSNSTPPPHPSSSGITPEKIGKIISLIRNSNNSQKQVLMALVELSSFFGQMGMLERISAGSTGSLQYFDRWISNVFLADGKYVQGLGAEIMERIYLLESIVNEAALEAAAREELSRRDQGEVEGALASHRSLHFSGDELPPM